MCRLERNGISLQVPGHNRLSLHRGQCLEIAWDLCLYDPAPWKYKTGCQTSEQEVVSQYKSHQHINDKNNSSQLLNFTWLTWGYFCISLGLNVYFLDLMISISLVLLLHWIIQGNACANNLCLFTWNCLGGPALWNGLVALWVQRFLQRSRHGL